MLRIEHGSALDHFQPAQFSVVTDKLFWTERRTHPDSFEQSFFNFFFRGGHLFARLQAYKMHFASAHPKSLARNVHELFHRDVRFTRIQPVGKNYTCNVRHKLLLLLAHCGTSHIDGHIAATNHNNPLSNGEAVTEVDVQKKIDAFYDAVQLMSRKIEVSAAVQAKREQHSFVALAAKVLKRKITTEPLVQAEFRPEIENFANLRLQHVAWQTIFWNAKVHHSARHRCRFENGHGIAK